MRLDKSRTLVFRFLKQECYKKKTGSFCQNPRNLNIKTKSSLQTKKSWQHQDNQHATVQHVMKWESEEVTCYWKLKKWCRELPPQTENHRVKPNQGLWSLGAVKKQSDKIDLSLIREAICPVTVFGPISSSAIYFLSFVQVPKYLSEKA